MFIPKEFNKSKETKTGILFVFLLLIVMSSCRQVNPFPGQKPSAIGKPNHVDVIMENHLAESPVWDSLDYYFASAYPVLPAPEPFFDLRHLTMEDLEFDPYKKELKTLIFVADISDTTSAVTKMVKSDLGEEKWNRAMSDPNFTLSIAREKWAKNQLIVYLFAKGPEALAGLMRIHFATVAVRINKHDEPALEASVYGTKGKNPELSELVKTKYNFNMDIPPTFVKAIEEENFLWLRADDKKSIQNFVIRKFPYMDANQFSIPNIIQLRDDYGKTFIQTNAADAYMRTNATDLPVYEYELDIPGMYGKEYRGIWETVNDFMGGPFISYLLLSKDKREIIFIDAFVLAPGEDKRNMMQKLDYVVKKSSL
jgi:hypothetical protein